MKRLICLYFLLTWSALAATPNIILVMTDDQGWGQTGYNQHPVLKTPNLDAMAAAGLRFDRFYAGAPVCSPTRASVLTGRSNDRTGVLSHGYPLRLQEKTLAQALKAHGYATGHFGKWHLNGLRGPGVPILKEDDHNPGAFGFDTWLSVSNFFDLNPVMSRQGVFEEFTGDSSEIIVSEALRFIGQQAKAKRPSFTVIWYGTPHSPFMASDEDKASFAALKKGSDHHYGELVAMDRSIGSLRKGLRDAGIADDTLVWFNSDNGGLPGIQPETVGGLRGFKGSVYEGGLRVPGIIEWPAGIPNPRVTKFPASTMDIFPTIAELTGLPASAQLQPADGMSLKPLFTKEIGPRLKPIPFRHIGNAAWVDNQYKLVSVKGKFALYDLEADPHETTDLSEQQPKIFQRLRSAFDAWDQTVLQSQAGKDYPEGVINPGEPAPRFWTEVEAYKPYFDSWKDRPEYADRIKGAGKTKTKKK
ncbi:MAG: arylsulfatase A-like enzyme [Kiritimatiellia bacterium]|jgi:arylsulfatase A-like enzyme